MSFTFPISTFPISTFPASTAPSNQPKEFFQPKLFQFKRHENLYCRSAGLWRIQSGFVRTFSWGLEGEPTPLGFWREGDIVGFAIAQAYPYEAQCLTAVTAEHLGSAYRFSREVALAHLKQSNDLLRIAHCRQAEMRLLLFVSWLAQRFGDRVPEGRQIQLKLTHQEIADSIGSTRVTVTRLLKGLERDGKLRWNAREKIVFESAIRLTRASLDYDCHPAA